MRIRVMGILAVKRGQKAPVGGLFEQPLALPCPTPGHPVTLPGPQSGGRLYNHGGGGFC